jgi:hypothetical protein
MAAYANRGFKSRQSALSNKGVKTEARKRFLTQSFQISFSIKTKRPVFGNVHLALNDDNGAIPPCTLAKRQHNFRQDRQYVMWRLVTARRSF